MESNRCRDSVRMMSSAVATVHVQVHAKSMLTDGIGQKQVLKEQSLTKVGFLPCYIVASGFHIAMSATMQAIDARDIPRLAHHLSRLI